MRRGAASALLVVGAVTALVVGTACPSLAKGGHHSPTTHFGAQPHGPASTTIHAVQQTTHSHGGSSGTSGTSGSSTSSYPGFSGSVTAAECAMAAGATAASQGTSIAAIAAMAPYCGTAGKKPTAPVITTQMVTQAATVSAPPSPPHVEPGTRSFVNLPNNYWTDSAVRHTSVTLFGITIPLTWTPVSVQWRFGDGTSATGVGKEGADVGDPDAVEHAYDRQGTYAITTVTTYDLSFTLPGRGGQTIRLTSPPSQPVDLPVGEVQTRVDYAG